MASPPLRCGSSRQEMLRVESEVAYTEAVIEEREQGIQEIQHQIAEVNEIFRDLAVLVKEQGVMIGEWGPHLLGTCFFFSKHSEGRHYSSVLRRSSTK